MFSLSHLHLGVSVKFYSITNRNISWQSCTNDSKEHSCKIQFPYLNWLPLSYRPNSRWSLYFFIRLHLGAGQSCLFWIKRKKLNVVENHGIQPQLVTHDILNPSHSVQRDSYWFAFQSCVSSVFSTQGTVNSTRRTHFWRIRPHDNVRELIGLIIFCYNLFIYKIFFILGNLIWFLCF